MEQQQFGAKIVIAGLAPDILPGFMTFAVEINWSPGNKHGLFFTLISALAMFSS